MAKLKALTVGLTLGLFLAVIYTLRTIAIWLFPNLCVNIVKKIANNMILIQPPMLTADAFVIGVIVLFVCGFVAGIIFTWIYNWSGK